MAWKKSSEGWRVIHNPVTAGATVVLDRQSALYRDQYPDQVAVRPDDLRRPHGAPKRHQFGTERSVPFPHGKTPYPAMYLGWIGGAGNMVNFEGGPGPLWGGGAAPVGVVYGSRRGPRTRGVVRRSARPSVLRGSDAAAHAPLSVPALQRPLLPAGSRRQ
jgi:hypothetical protein